MHATHDTQQKHFFDRTHKSHNHITFQFFFSTHSFNLNQNNIFPRHTFTPKHKFFISSQPVHTKFDLIKK